MTDLLERIGVIADKADNFYHATMLPLPPKIHTENLSAGMKDIRDELRAIVIEFGHENPWEES